MTNSLVGGKELDLLLSLCSLNVGERAMKLMLLSTALPEFLITVFFCFCFFLFVCFIYFWLRWVFVAAHELSLVAVSGGYSSLRCVGSSLRWLLLLWSTGSRRVGFSSCGTWAQ